MPVSARCRLAHALKLRRVLRLKNPRTFTEKVSWRMVYDRRDLLKPTCDKKAMKTLAADRAGGLVRIPRTIWSGTDLDELTTIELPEHWVLKPNHRSGLVHIGHGAPRPDQLAAKTVGWLDEVNWSEYGEWAYSHAERSLLVEEFIGVPGEIPVDFKFEVFDGVVRAAWVHLGRFSDFRGFAVDRDFQRLAVQGPNKDLHEGEVFDKPGNFDAMVQAAERIAAGFDYLRVDLYNTRDHVWFGETTPYPANGTLTIRPPSFDYAWGSYWKLPQLP